MLTDKILQPFKLAFNELTISRFHTQPPTPDTVRKSLYWYPLAGLYIGIAASLLPLFFVACFSSLQAFVLFSGCIYVFMTAWLSRFSGFRDLAIFTDALAERKLSPAERVQKMLSEQTHPGYAGVTACAILASSKLLLIYLLFTRLALFEKTALLGFFLITTPFFARLFMMLLAGNNNVAPGEPEVSIAGKVNTTYLYLLLIIAAIFGIVFLGLCYGFGEFVHVFAPQKTFATITHTFTIWSQRTDFAAQCLLQGSRIMACLYGAGLFACIYIGGETKAWMGGRTKIAAGAGAEIAEIAILAGALIAADFILL
jgi:hypothetical protein